MGSNPRCVRKRRRLCADADRVIDAYVAKSMQADDANDLLYAIEASHDYDPGPELEQIKRRCLRSTPPMTSSIRPSSVFSSGKSNGCRHGKAVVLPYSEHTGTWLAHHRGVMEAVPRGVIEGIGALRQSTMSQQVRP